jgi:CRP-like cAMP-binding protein
MKHMADLMKLREWSITKQPGEILVEYGAEPKAMYILVQGFLDVVVNDKTVTTISEPGTYIGELSYILNHTYSATVVAKETTEAIQIKSEYIDYFIKSLPAVVFELAEQMALRVATLRKDVSKQEPQKSPKRPNEWTPQSIPEMDPQGWNQLIRKLNQEIVTLNPGEHLAHEGHSATQFYILKSGRIKATKAAKEVKTIYKPGECIGELPFLLNQKHVVSYQADSQTQVIQVEKNKVIEIIEQNPLFARVLLISVASRLVMLSSMVAFD